MKRCPALILAFFCASVAVSSANAAPQDDPSTRLVPYGDLDLATPGGRRALDQRIEQALNVVCFDPYGPSPAGVVEPDCKVDGRRAALGQVSVVVARLRSGNATAEAVLPIQIPKASRKRPANR